MNLQEMEETFNSTGKRRIAKFEMSVADPEVLEESAADEKPQAQKTEFDMDVYSHEYKAAAKGGRKKQQLFGRAETSRGKWNLSDEDGIDPHDPFGQGPALQRYSAPILYPVLDSFPSIFHVGSGNSKKLAVHSALSTSTAVANQIRTMDEVVRRMIGLEDRETLSNGLQVMAEEYEEGYDSGSDSGHDDD